MARSAARLLRNVLLLAEPQVLLVALDAKPAAEAIERFRTCRRRRRERSSGGRCSRKTAAAVLGERPGRGCAGEREREREKERGAGVAKSQQGRRRAGRAKAVICTLQLNRRALVIVEEGWPALT